MTKIATRVASALSFAHLTGLGRSSAKRARAEDDEDKKARRAQEEDDEQDERSEGDDPDAEDDDRQDDKQSRRARAADNPDDDEDKPSSKKAKRAKADGDDPEDDPDAEDDDDEEEMNGSGSAAKARARERARFAAIFSSKAAARNLPLAMSLACNTRMTRRQVIAVLRDAPAAQALSGVNNHRESRNPNLGTDRGESSRQASVASSWDAAMKKARGV
ncbi:hypothetical protein L2Y94_05705 [Luteibacter aegosomatis]|uniref:hypothetical protein n=1 Tax=Luteibacter aegosomatis TaxID=2911537 RepID=UPI001FFA82C1|nr:hypothetical protein [Luteibacter aegosomatis]UPG86849.1 hypothetical protein L2Y94_05705 [Luteibacter aegosomatis]